MIQYKLHLNFSAVNGEISDENENLDFKNWIKILNMKLEF